MRLGARLAAAVRGGDCLCLRGPLGSGKTTFARISASSATWSASPTSASSRSTARSSRCITSTLSGQGGELANLGSRYLGDPAAACLVGGPRSPPSIPKGPSRLPLDHIGEEDLSVSAAGRKPTGSEACHAHLALDTTESAFPRLLRGQGPPSTAPSSSPSESALRRGALLSAAAGPARDGASRRRHKAGSRASGSA